MRRIGVLTSGGDAPGMNACVRAIVRFGIHAGFEVYGIHRGYEGLIEGDIRQLTSRDVGDIIQKGGTVIKTARCPKFQTEEGMKRALRNIETFRLDAVIVIGGNGSFTGANRLSKRGVPVICIPGTIDNDLGYTERTIGFDTAVNTVLDAITRIRDTSSAHDRTTVIEVMGRHCGDLALAAGITGGAEIVLAAEHEMDINDICRKLIESINNGKQHSLIIRAEGYPVSSQELVEMLSDKIGRDIKLVVLSYLQRGGSPSYVDRMLAIKCADKAIDLIKEGIYNKAIGQIHGEIVGLDLEAALSQESEFEKHWLEAVDILSR